MTRFLGLLTVLPAAPGVTAQLISVGTNYTRSPADNKTTVEKHERVSLTMPRPFSAGAAVCPYWQGQVTDTVQSGHRLDNAEPARTTMPHLMVYLGV